MTIKKTGMNKLENLENVNSYLQKALQCLDMVEEHWDADVIDEGQLELILYAAGIVHDVQLKVEDETNKYLEYDD